VKFRQSITVAATSETKQVELAADLAAQSAGKVALFKSQVVFVFNLVGGCNSSFTLISQKRLGPLKEAPTGLLYYWQFTKRDRGFELGTTEKQTPLVAGWRP